MHDEPRWEFGIKICTFLWHTLPTHRDRHHLLQGGRTHQYSQITGATPDSMQHVVFCSSIGNHRLCHRRRLLQRRQERMMQHADIKLLQASEASAGTTRCLAACGVTVTT